MKKSNPENRRAESRDDIFASESRAKLVLWTGSGGNGAWKSLPFFFAAIFAALLLSFAQAVPSSAAGEVRRSSDESSRDGGRGEFSKVLGMVFDERTGAPVADCLVNFGEKKIRTDENGFFEFRNFLAGEYVVSVDSPPFQKYAEVVRIVPPLSVVRVTLSVPVMVSEDEIARAEYDTLLSTVMRMNTNEVTIGDEDDRPAAKVEKPYFSPFGRSSGRSEKAASGRTGKARKDDIEESKQPKISTARGFAKLSGRVLAAGGAPVEGTARVIIGPRVVLTDKSGAFELQNIPVGSYDVVIKCRGYATKSYEKVEVDRKHTKYDFYLTKAPASEKKPK